MCVCRYDQLAKAVAGRREVPDAEVKEEVRNVLMSLVNVSHTHTHAHTRPRTHARVPAGIPAATRDTAQEHLYGRSANLYAS